VFGYGKNPSRRKILDRKRHAREDPRPKECVTKNRSTSIGGGWGGGTILHTSKVEKEIERRMKLKRGEEKNAIYHMQKFDTRTPNKHFKTVEWLGLIETKTRGGKGKKEHPRN